MARAPSTTKYQIVKFSSEFFFTVGYSNTSPKMIAEKLQMSQGNITHYFPTKEHLLCVIVEMLCDYQWKMLESVEEHGYGSVGAICMEMMTVAESCERSEIARDFFTAVFESEMCRNYLRRNHVERAKRIFAKECEGWSDHDFEQAELMVMGLQFATIATSDADIPLKVKIAGALDKVLEIYRVDAQTRSREINRVMSMEREGISRQVLEGFIHYVNRTSEEALEEMRETVQKRNQEQSKLPTR